MYLENLKLHNYRNYEKLNLDFCSHFNIFIGANAQGKTNLLEAIYYLSTGKAYRPAHDDQLIKWNNQGFFIKGEIKNKMGTSVLDIIFNNTNQGSKEIKINSIKINKTVELLGTLTSVLFAPEDINIIKGSPSERRRLLDNDISQTSPSYYIKLHQLNRVLNQRNHLLKKKYSQSSLDDELEVWDNQLLNISIEIIQKRMQFLEKLIPLTRLIQRKLTNGLENLEIKYLLNKQEEIRKNDDIRELLITELKKYRSEEKIRGITLWGPQRDDLGFYLNGNNLKYYGSQGQHRTSVLAVKLAELEFFKAESGEYPLLLLDDVMSELDKERREQLVNTILEKSIQCFITTTEDVLFVLENNSEIKKIMIKQGKIFDIKGGT